MILDKLHELVVKADGNVPALRKHIAQHLDGLWNVYKNKEFERKQINVWKERDPKKFESIHVIDLQLIYATCTTNRHIASIIIKTDGIGLRDYQPLSNMAVIGIKWVQCVPLVASSRSLTGVSIATLNVVCIISARGGKMPNATHSHTSWRRSCCIRSWKTLRPEMLQMWAKCSSFHWRWHSREQWWTCHKMQAFSALWHLLWLQQRCICLWHPNKLHQDIHNP